MKNEIQTVEMTIKGMTCDSCQAHVEHALQGVSGVKRVNVPGWKSAHATVTAAPGVTSEQLTESVRDAGYRAQVESRSAVGTDDAVPTGGERARTRPIFS